MHSPNRGCCLLSPRQTQRTAHSGCGSLCADLQMRSCALPGILSGWCLQGWWPWCARQEAQAQVEARPQYCTGAGGWGADRVRHTARHKVRHGQLQDGKGFSPVLKLKEPAGAHTAVSHTGCACPVGGCCVWVPAVTGSTCVRWYVASHNTLFCACCRPAALQAVADC